MVTMNVAYAGPLGTNITVSDNNTGYVGIGIGSEDNETEPGTIHSQDWDLEAFFLNGNTLSMVGGYNFKDGVNYGNKLYTTGDIFIDVTGDAKYGTPSTWTGLNQYGWDYAIQMNFSNKTYEVWEINSATPVLTVSDVPSSNPWKLDGTPSGQPITGTFDFSSTTTNPYEGLTAWDSGTHYTVSGFDLGFLGIGKNFTVDYTISCGNDNMIGQGTTVPEPGTLVLLGLGICGLAGFKKFSHKK